MTPATIAELTPRWLSEALGAHVSSVTVIDAHSGTTGRARLQLTGSVGVPDTVFVKLQPFDADQREYVRMIGMGVIEARLYAELASELDIRIPRVWHSSYDAEDGSFIMVLEDLAASGCRFPTADDVDVIAIAESLVDELPKLHAPFWGRDIPWLRYRALGAGGGAHQNQRMGRLAEMVQSAVEQFAGDLPPEFEQMARLYLSRYQDLGELWNEGDITLLHGDDHIGNLFLDGSTVGFYDWAVACQAAGMRDVAYFVCNALPTERRRAYEFELIDHYRANLSTHGVTLEHDLAYEQYRLFVAYSWLAATTTAAMGSKWHPSEVAQSSVVRITQAIIDLDVIGLLTSRLDARTS